MSTTPDSPASADAPRATTQRCTRCGVRVSGKLRQVCPECGGRLVRLEPSAKVRVLLVDDSRLDREKYAGLLRQLGAEVETCPDGAAALARLNVGLPNPDRIVLDVLMPEMDGLATLAVLRHDPVLTTIPVLLLTSVADPPAVRSALQLGPTSYLLKNNDLATLRDRLAAFIARP